MNKKKVILMCGGSGCCPTLTFEKNQVLIEDDFGGKVTLTNDQFDLLKEKVRKKEL